MVWLTVQNWVLMSQNVIVLTPPPNHFSMHQFEVWSEVISSVTFDLAK